MRAEKEEEGVSEELTIHTRWGGARRVAGRGGGPGYLAQQQVGGRGLDGVVAVPVHGELVPGERVLRLPTPCRKETPQ